MAEELEAHAGSHHKERHQRSCQSEGHPDRWSVEDALQGEGILHLRQGGARKDWHVFLEAMLAMLLCTVKASAPVNCRTSMYDSRLSPGMGLLADRTQPA